MADTAEAQTRWDIAVGSIKEATAALDTNVHFGLLKYPLPQPNISDPAETCGAVLDVAPALAQAGAIASALDGTAAPLINQGHTPIRAAVELARAELAKPAYADRPRYLLLVTDGVANCKGDTPNGTPDLVAVNAALGTLSDDGVTTFVVGYLLDQVAEAPWVAERSANMTATAMADELASHGGTGFHYPVSSGADLQAVIAEITASVAPCTFALDDAIPDPQYVRVTVDNTDLHLDDADGWKAEGAHDVVLVGSACESLRDGESHSIEINVECLPVIPR
jgi:hypothetical protein